MKRTLKWRPYSPLSEGACVRRIHVRVFVRIHNSAPRLLALGGALPVNLQQISLIGAVSVNKSITPAESEDGHARADWVCSV